MTKHLPILQAATLPALVEEAVDAVDALALLNPHRCQHVTESMLLTLMGPWSQSYMSGNAGRSCRAV